MTRKAARWTTADIPDQRGRVAVITGSNTGLGFDTADALLAKGATVVLACRDRAKAAAAAERLRAVTPGGEVDVVALDLADLASVLRAAATIRDRYERVDLLINNAGVMWTPRRTTADGFELQLGTNHLGHFAFTGLLLDRFSDVPGARVVTLASIAHRAGRIHFDDPQLTRRYGRQKAYGQSKLANLLFAYRLNALLIGAGRPAIAVAAHPGVSRTELGRNAPAAFRVFDRLAGPLYLQSSRMGALPILRAATDPSVSGGEYYGPDGVGGARGFPARVSSSAASHDLDVQERLWRLSEELTGVSYDL